MVSSTQRTKNNQPFAIIIVPTRELAFQVYSVLEKLLGTQNENRLDLDIACDMHHDLMDTNAQISNKLVNQLYETHDDGLHRRPVDIL